MKRNLVALVISGLFLCGLLAAGYYHEAQVSKNSFTPQQAIQKYKHKYVSDFPDQPGQWETVFRNIGGKPPGKTIPMQVETLIEPKDQSVYILTLKETWNAYDFNYNNASKQPILSHETFIKVTPTTVEIVGDSGDQEPDIP